MMSRHDLGDPHEPVVPESGKGKRQINWIAVGAIGTLLGGVAAVAALWVAFGDGDDAARETAPTTSEEATPTPNPRIDKFNLIDRQAGISEFKVAATTMECGAKRPGLQAKGKYCIVKFQVRNDSQAADFPSVAGTIFVGEQSFPGGPEEEIDDLFPGEAQSGTLSFDIPKEATPSRLVIRANIGDEEFSIYEVAPALN